MAAAKEEYANNPAAFGTALTGGRPVYYTPAGYRAVRQILVKLAEEDTQAITEKEGELSPLKSALDTAQVEINRLEGLLKAEDAPADADQAYLNEKLSGWAEDEVASFRELLGKDSLTEEEQQTLKGLQAKLADYAALPDAQAAHDSRAGALWPAGAALRQDPEKTDGHPGQPGPKAPILKPSSTNTRGPGPAGHRLAVTGRHHHYVPAFTAGALALARWRRFRAHPHQLRHLISATRDYEEARPAGGREGQPSGQLLQTKQNENYQKLEADGCRREVVRYLSDEGLRTGRLRTFGRFRSGGILKECPQTP